jgi:CheY-like chemotaxis protein
VARTIARILGSRHEVVTVGRAEDGLAFIDGGQRFDAILCDLQMPFMSGIEFAARLEITAPDQAARIVFVTGGAATAEVRAFLDADLHRRVDKPFTPAALRGVVDEVIANG